MANLNVSVILGLVDRLSAPLRGVSAQLDQMHERIERIAAMSANATLIGEALAQTGRGILEPIQGAARSAMDLESAMADVRKVVDFDTPEGFAALAREIEMMTRRIPLAAEQLAEIAAAGGQLGIAAPDLSGYVETVAKMATAFDMLPGVAGEAMAKLSNIYAIPIAGIGALGDAINHLSDNSAAKASEIVEVLGRIGGVAQPFGLSAQQAAALAAAMIALGETPERAGTSIEAMLTQLTTANQQGERFQEALKAIGLSGESMAAAIREDAQGALTDLLGRLNALDAQSRSGLLVDLFGMEHAAKIAKLAGNLDQYHHSLSLTSDETEYAGSMQVEFAARAATTANGLALLANRVAEMRRRIGEALLPVISELAERLGGVVTRVAEWLQAHPRLTRALVIGAAALGAFALAGGTLLIAAAGIVGGLGMLAVALSPILSLLGLAWRAMQLFGFVTLLAGRALALSVLPALSALPAALAAKIAALRAATLASLAWARANLLTLAGLRGLLAAAGGAVLGALRGLTAGLHGAMLAARGLALALLTNPITWVVAAMAGAALLIYKYWEPIKGFFVGLWSGLVEGLAPIAGAFSEAFGGIMPVIQPVLDGLGWLWDKLTALLAPVQDTGGAAEAMGKRWGLAIAGMITEVGKLLASLLALPGKMLKIGADIVQGLWDGWQSKWGAFKAWVSGLADIIPSWLKKPLGVQSPSRVFAEIGRNLVEGLQQGVARTAPTIMDEFGGLAKRLAGVALVAGPVAMAPAVAMTPPVPRLPSAGIEPQRIETIAQQARPVVPLPVTAPPVTRLPNAGIEPQRIETIVQQARPSTGIEPQRIELSDPRRDTWLRDARAWVQSLGVDLAARVRPPASVTPPPARPRASGPISMPITVTITAPTGTDPRQLAALVREEVAKAGRTVGRQLTGALYDHPDDM